VGSMDDTEKRAFSPAASSTLIVTIVLPVVSSPVSRRALQSVSTGTALLSALTHVKPVVTDVTFPLAKMPVTITACVTAVPVSRAVLTSWALATPAMRARRSSVVAKT